MAKMINLAITIGKIQQFLKENTESSLTYAALECRLALERICYERLRTVHDYISHDDLKKWQPREVMNTLIQEVDTKVTETYSMFVSDRPIPPGSSPTTLEQYEAMNWLPLGTQVGFDPNKIGKLWNALSSVALHVRLPRQKSDQVSQYGDMDAIREKVNQALTEILRISEATLSSTGVGEEVSFDCFCGVKNKRKLELMTDGRIINCVNLDCSESFIFRKKDIDFERRTHGVTCSNCGNEGVIPMKKLEKLKINHYLKFDCVKCEFEVLVCWRLMTSVRTKE